MHRRELLRVLGAAAAALPFTPRHADAAVRYAEAVHRRLSTERATGGAALRVFSPEQNELVTAMSEMVIPETETPGAKAVRVNEFLDLLLADWSSEDDRDHFLKGLDAIDRESRGTYGKRFIELAEPERALLLRALEGQRDSSSDAARTFADLKRLTVYAYFTSEVVQKNVLKTEMWPGRYDGCVSIELQGTGAPR